MTKVAQQAYADREERMQSNLDQHKAKATHHADQHAAAERKYDDHMSAKMHGITKMIRKSGLSESIVTSRWLFNHWRTESDWQSSHRQSEKQRLSRCQRQQDHLHVKIRQGDASILHLALKTWRLIGRL